VLYIIKNYVIRTHSYREWNCWHYCRSRIILIETGLVSILEIIFTNKNSLRHHCLKHKYIVLYNTWSISSSQTIVIKMWNERQMSSHSVLPEITRYSRLPTIYRAYGWFFGFSSKCLQHILVILYEIYKQCYDITDAASMIILELPISKRFIPWGKTVMMMMKKVLMIILYQLFNSYAIFVKGGNH